MFDVEVAIQSALEGRSEREIRRWNKFQEEQRAKLQLGNPNSVHGQRAIELALDALSKEDSEVERERLAEGYFLLGEFEKALETPNEQKRVEYQKYLDALTSPECSCPKKLNGHKTKFLKDQVYVKGRLVNFFGCSVCHHLSC